MCIYVNFSLSKMIERGFFYFNWRIIALQCCIGSVIHQESAIISHFFLFNNEMAILFPKVATRLMVAIKLIKDSLTISGASQVALMVKNPAANAGDKKKKQLQYLSWEDTLEEGMATQSRILAWRIPWTEEPGRLRSIGRTESGMTEAT